MSQLLKLKSIVECSVLRKNFHVSSMVNGLDHKWRQQKGLPTNPNAEGPLTNLPDYTFMDGRPTPLGQRQKRRLLQQRDIARKIVTMSKELDFAIERHEKLKLEKEQEKQHILKNKLKPKGHLLLKK